MVATVELIGGALDGTKIPVPDILVGSSLPSILVLQGPITKANLRYVRFWRDDESDDILYGFLDYVKNPHCKKD